MKIDGKHKSFQHHGCFSLNSSTDLRYGGKIEFDMLHMTYAYIAFIGFWTVRRNSWNHSFSVYFVSFIWSMLEKHGWKLFILKPSKCEQKTHYDHAKIANVFNWKRMLHRRILCSLGFVWNGWPFLYLYHSENKMWWNGSNYNFQQLVYYVKR